MSKKSFIDHHFSMNTFQKYKDIPLFEVPDHYFENMQRNVMRSIAKECKRKTAIKKWVSVASVAASFALIVMFSIYLIVNRNPNEHFYVFEEIAPSKDLTQTLDSNHLAEATEIVVNEFLEVQPETLFLKAPLVETIVYRVVDFYVDDYETDNFYEVMYDLEFDYDY